ncbi:TRAP transporter small permease, partial [Bradyrhizobium sp.]|uniref:TRAP transporter small permease n=1 Tax=Bradyrhizobium sp. TaxID=376 RepID=UPI003C25E7A0
MRTSAIDVMLTDAQVPIALAPPASSELTPLRFVDRTAESLIVAALLGELVLVLANIVARVFFQHSFLWTDEIARTALSIMAFIGGAVAYRRRDHAFVRVILSRLPAGGERGCLAFADVVVLFVAGITGFVSIEFLISSWDELTPIFQMPAALIALPLPVGMALLMLYAAVNLRRDHGAMALGVGAVFVAVVTIAALTRDVWLPLLGEDAA